MTKLFKISLILLIPLLILVSCFSKPQAKPQIKPKIKIGVCLAENKTERNKYLEDNFKKLAKENKLNLVITTANKDSLNQKTNIEKMIKEKVQAVILQPVNTSLAKDYISMLQENNIKVILLDALPEEVAVDGFIAPDYLRSGELQAQFILKQATQDMNILILKGDKQNNITANLLEGNLNILNNNSLVKELEIVEIQNWDQNNAYNALTTKIKEKSFDTIITHYEEIALGVTKYFNENSKDKKEINFSGVGLNEQVVKLIQEEKNKSAIDTLPNLLTQISIEAVSDLINNESWEYDLLIENGMANVPTKLIPVRLITQDNLYLLQERLGETLKEQSSNNSEQQKSQNQSPQNKTNLKIKTKDGKEYNVVIPGDIEGIEMLPQEDKS